MLAEILAYKKREVEERKRLMSLETLMSLVPYLAPSRSFMKALQSKKLEKKPAVIAEIKKASPSKGILRASFDPVDIALSYAEHGAACLSILTDQHFFQGADEYIEQVKQQVSLPVLRKEFIIDSYQVYESRVLGADAILLIVAALDNDDLIILATLAKKLGMEVLLELHSLAELNRILALEAQLIAQGDPLRFDLFGINNRNLSTFITDIQVSLDLLNYIPASKFIISESGISNKAQIDTLSKAGVDGFLIGESLMKASSPGDALEQLLG